METNFDKRKALIFAISVCLFSWAAFGAFYLVTGCDPTANKILFSLFECLYMFFPMLVAVVLQLIRKEPLTGTGLLNFRLSWTWLVALMLPLLIVAVCIPVSALMPGVKLHFGLEQVVDMFGMDESQASAAMSQMQSIPPVLFIALQVLSGIIAGCTINALFAFGEEYGWRNYMADALRGLGFWKKALFIGLVWGIWHAPLILLGHNYPQHPVAGVGMMCIFCTLLGAIELYFVLKTGSVFPAAIIHGTINAAAGLVLYFVRGGNDLTIGVTGIAGFISMALALAAIYIFDRFVSRERIFGQQPDQC